MIYTHYGNTGIEVSRLGFGGMRFEKPADIDAMAEVVLHAHNLGITYFDTAPFYCEDKSEIIIGTAIKEMKKSGKPFYISTKSGGDTELDVRKSIEKSLKRLNVDSIDFFHCWCILSVARLKKRIKGGAMKAMEDAKEEGLIKHIAVSTHLPAERMEEAFGLYPFEGVTCGFNAFNYRMRGEGVKIANSMGMGVVAMNPLAGGAIPQFEDKFSFIKKYPDQKIIESALNFVWNEEFIDVALVGCRNKTDVDEAVAAAKAFRPDPSWRSEVESRSPDFAENLCTGCRYCEVCPEKIPVFKYMDAYNNFLLRKDWKSMKDCLKYFWGIHDLSELEKCTECGACEKKCTQHIEITKRFKKMRKHFDN